MWPFNRKRDADTKAAAPKRTALYPNYGNLHPAWFERNPESFAREAYIQNAIAFACVTKVAKSAASVRLQLERTGKDGKVEIIERHPLLDLLRRPNPATPGPLFFEALIGFRRIAGNAYVVRPTPVTSAKKPPTELWLLRPERVTVIGGDALPKAYRYRSGDIERDYPVDQITGRSDVLHLKTFHPLSDWYGLSPMEASAFSVDTFNKAQAWNKALLDNGARPSGAVVMNGKDGQGTLSEEQFQRLKGEIDEQYSGSRNAGRPMLLEGGLDWKEMSLNPKDMDHIEGLWANARIIALTHDVPPQMLGIPGDSTFANFEQAQLSFWENTVLPELDSVLEYLNAWLVPQFGEDLTLSYDEDSIRALEPRRELMFKRAKDAEFLTINEKRVMVGFDELGEEGNLVLVKTGQVPLDMVGADLSEPETLPSGEDEEEPEQGA
ncbi:phage portal protein (plasmid) [Skermanella rosea]|uniref:phage portal protein n=1 Tax=Skermanella rosea TaxID=1817965 RepID=UPI0019329BB6|nr:phage portal protein [Skermanella rosea]UEM08075.1 phage portal protein [Skermanella rosea]